MAQLTSTSQIYRDTIGFIGRSQAALTEAHRQIASGKKYSSFATMVGQVARLKGLQDASGRTNSYMRSISRVTPRLQAVENTITQLIDVATELRDNISLRQSNPDLNLADLAKNNLETIEQLLNGKIDGQYIFAGSKSNTPPIRSNLEIVKNYGSSDDNPFKTNSNYYLGDTVSQSVRISDGREIAYGITADNNAFQQMISAAHLGIEFNSSENDDVFTLATDQINAAIESLIALQNQNGSDLNALNNARDSHEIAKLSLETQIAGITDTDIIQASLDVSFNETILQATFSTFARITSLNLIDFIR